MLEQDIKAILAKLAAMEALAARLENRIAPKERPAKWLVVNEAAKAFGLNPQQIRYLILTRQIAVANLSEKRVLVDTESLAEYLRGHREHQQQVGE